IKTKDYIVTHALNLDLVTFAPTWGRRLRMPGAEYGVYENDPSSPARFGGYVYHTMRMRSVYASITVAQGIDLLTAGCVVQRAIHQGAREDLERVVFFKILEQLPILGGPIAEAMRDGMKSPLFNWVAGAARSARHAQDESYRCPHSGEKLYWGIE